ncbi:flagellar assembly peptidoglycan hydrolase FlgJ [Rehaibacterium terrae]|uniref:flagellar assembly peptidoglycan hydrolase FlgJ n=1 Tax=Rehaibacterium terrae TaxID=1341696 RepID=UPI00391B8924
MDLVRANAELARLAAAQAPARPAGNDPAAIDRAARELEGAFARMLIASMRQTSLGDAMFAGDAGHFRDLYDQQLARAISQGQGLGLAPMIRRQLGGEAAPASAGDTPPASRFHSLDGYSRPQAARRILNELASLGIPVKTAPAPIDQWQPTRPDGLAARSAPPSPEGKPTPEQFVARVWPHAQRAAAELGVDPRTLVAQAALETGWGRHGIRRDDGGDAHNLFGIKATGWQGDKVARSTREFENGVERREVAEFRAYRSPAESFADYVRLLKTSPRYAEALDSGGDGRRFAQSLQRAGYATDPQYAAKLTAIAEGPTLRRALAQLGITEPSKA